MVLILLTVLSLGLGAMFAEAGANLTTSTVVTGQDNKVYAADGGVEYAIQQLRANSALCRADGALPNTTSDGHTVSINGRPVDVRCKPAAGLATSVSPWALVTTDMTDPSSLSTPSGASEKIDGPVYVSGGVNLQSPLTVTSGEFLLNPTGACPSPSGGWTCTTAPAPDPAPALPAAPPTARPPTPAFVYNGCSIWKPGKYTSISLGPDNYFASGIYYFEDTSIDLGGKTAVGGQPGPDYPQVLLPPTACGSVTDKTAGAASGSGVEFILGGSSTISLHDGSTAAQLELFARVPGSSSEGTPGVSMRTVPSSPPPGWKPTTTGHPVVLSSTGASRLAIHGYVYVPEGSVAVAANGNVPLPGGLFCWQVALNSSSGVQISAQNGAQPRYAVITSTAPAVPSDLAPKAIISTAVVAIGNDALRTVIVQSWLTPNP